MTSESPPPHKKNGQALPVPVRADEGIRTDRPEAGERRAVRAKEADVRIFEEILSALGIAEDVAFGGAKVVLYAGRCAYFENVQSVLSFSAEEVVLRLKRGEVRARGKDLCVARYGGGDLLLVGDVRAVESTPRAGGREERAPSRGEGRPRPQSGGEGRA